MKFLSLFSATCIFILSATPVFAANPPEGSITFYNNSNKTITAQVSSFGKFNIAANEQKNVAYSSLARICSSNPTSCTAQFFVDNKPAGSATINTTTGKLVHMKLAFVKVLTTKVEQVLRSVVIK